MSQLDPRSVWVAALILCGAMTAACTRSSAEPASGAVDLPRPAYAITGIDSAGGTFKLSEQHGRVVVLSFGFTSCPDVCPTTLAKAKGLVRRLGDQARDVSIVFVSVDPERDSPERLGSYISGFDPGFHGVYVERERLKPLLDAYNVVATKRELDTSRIGGDASRFYSIDHTAGFQIIDKVGQLQAKIPPAASLESIAAIVERLLRDEAVLRVLSPHARIPAGAPVGAVYLRIQNATSHADRLLSVRSPDAERAELHESIDDNGVMRMVPRPEGLAVGAGATLDLAEGGKHVMLMGLSPRDAAAPLTLELQFERAGTLEVKVPVVSATE